MYKTKDNGIKNTNVNVGEIDYSEYQNVNKIKANGKNS